MRFRITLRPYDYCGRTCGALATAVGNQVTATVVMCKVGLFERDLVGTMSHARPLAMQSETGLSESPVLREELRQCLDGRAWSDQYRIHGCLVAFILESESAGGTGRWSTGAETRRK